METIKIQLVPGKHVRHPDTKEVIGPEPLIVEKSSYWYRRLFDGSVILVDDVTSKPKAPKPATEIK